jgi:hypothetical protein
MATEKPAPASIRLDIPNGCERLSNPKTLAFYAREQQAFLGKFHH